ncbi:MAG: hypothetical protein ACK57V_15440, partial [Pirellula sp.]
LHKTIRLCFNQSTNEKTLDRRTPWDSWPIQGFIVSPALESPTQGGNDSTLSTINAPGCDGAIQTLDFN